MQQRTGTRLSVGLLMLIGFWLATGPLASARDTNTQTTVTPPPKVTKVENEAKQSQLELGQIIRIDIAPLSEWASKNNVRRLVPYVNGLELTGTYPVEVHTAQNHLRFHLAVTPENQEVWAALLRKPKVRRPVSVSVGLENDQPFDTVFGHDNRLPLITIPPVWASSPWGRSCSP